MREHGEEIVPTAIRFGELLDAASPSLLQPVAESGEYADQQRHEYKHAQLCETGPVGEQRLLGRDEEIVQRERREQGREQPGPKPAEPRAD